MAKSQLLNFTQNLNTVQTTFDFALPVSVIAVATTTAGSNLTTGARTFTIAGGTAITAATFTATATGTTGSAYLTSAPVLTNVGSYTVAPTAPNTPTVDSGTTNATFAVTVGMLNTLYTAAANDAVIKAITVSSTDTVARNMSVWINTGTGGDKLLGVVPIPASSGANGALASIDLLTGSFFPALPFDANGKRGMPLKAGTIVKVSVPGVTASTNIFVEAMVEEY